MQETRKQFISRMTWMINEIDESKFSSLNALSMMEYELKKRDVELIKHVRDLIVNFIHLHGDGGARSELKRFGNVYKQNAKRISVKTELRFNELIKEID